MKSFIIFLSLVFSLIAFGQQLKWRTLPNSPSESSRFEDCYFINSNTGWIVSLSGRIHRTTDAGNSWSLIYNNGNLRFRSIGFFDSLNGIAGLYFAPTGTTVPVYKTTNGGFNWIMATIPSPIPAGICGISIVDNFTMYGCGKIDGPAVVIKTTDRGNTWQSINMTGNATRVVDCHFFSADSGFVSGGIGSNNGGQEIILFTSNGGLNWITRFTHSRVSSYAAFWKISVLDRMNLVASFNNLGDSLLFIKTSNGGITWDLFVTPLNREYFTQGIAFVNSMTGWLGGDFGYQLTYETTDGGISWHENDFGKAVNRIQFLSDTIGYAVGSRVYKYSRDSLIGIIQIGNPIPLNYTLNQNYPNPFNPATLIRFELPNESDVKIVIFDLLGNELSCLVDNYFSAGIYQVSWDGKDKAGNDVSSGVYFYKIVTPKWINSKKMVLIR